jgi:hypothetical protein
MAVCYTNGQLNPANNCQQCTVPSTTVNGPTAWAGVSAGTVCRPVAGVCDAAETCNGSGAACPADAPVAAGTMCTPPTGGVCSGFTCGCPSGSVQCGTTCVPGSRDLHLGRGCMRAYGQRDLRKPDARCHERVGWYRQCLCADGRWHRPVLGCQRVRTDWRRYDDHPHDAHRRLDGRQRDRDRLRLGAPLCDHLQRHCPLLGLQRLRSAR